MNSLLSFIWGNKDEERRAREYRDLIRQEAKIGGTLFGPLPKGRRREFFCLDEHTWVWHEEWTDKQSRQCTITTRYDVRPHGIFKAQDGRPYQPLSRSEIQNFYAAVLAYHKAVNTKLFNAHA